MFNVPSAASQPFLIGIAGGTASGKTTVCRRIIESLGGQRVALLSIDEFYRDLTPEECADIGNVNFDEPDAFDIETMAQCLDTLKDGQAADVPIYDFVTSKRDPTQVRHVSPADVVIVEGILVLHVPELVKRFNMKIYVDTDDDVRLARRIRRDTVERGRDVEGVIRQYTMFVKPSFDRYVSPSKLNADVIIPWSKENPVAVDLITQHVRTKLSQNDLTRVYRNLCLVPSTMQTRGMHTVIRNRESSREDFVFYADRLIRLVVEHALGQLPFEERIVTTPGRDTYTGLSFSRRHCGVSIIRSGEAMENALRACCAGIRIGKILVTGTDRAELAYEKLPHDISQRHVLLMDPILASGQGVKNAIERLTQHRHVQEEKIILLSLIAAPRGIHTVCEAFPKIKVITSEIDEGLDDDGYVRPGCGDFGDRYFGTGSREEELQVSHARTFKNVTMNGHHKPPSSSGHKTPSSSSGGDDTR
jgi:uridine kinase